MVQLLLLFGFCEFERAGTCTGDMYCWDDVAKILRTGSMSETDRKSNVNGFRSSQTSDSSRFLSIWRSETERFIVGSNQPIDRTDNRNSRVTANDNNWDNKRVVYCICFHLYM